MPNRPFTICVVCREAKSADEANVVCKTTEAYRKILAQYPSTEWDRKWVRTYCEEPSAGSGFWMVEFEVTRKAGDK